MSDTNRVDIGIVEEATLGVTPPTPAFETLRVTGAPDLAFTPSTVTSEELRADRQVSDLVLVGAAAGGGLPYELSYGSFDTLLQAAMFSTWITSAQRQNTAAGSDISAVILGEYTVVDVNKPFAEGQMVRASGFGENDNNALFRAEALSDADTVVYTGAIAEATPPVGAKLKVVGFQGEVGDIEATLTGLTSTLLDFTTLGLTVGNWIKIGGSGVNEAFDTAPCNDWVVISSITANEILFNNLPTGWAADAGVGKTITVTMGDYIRNGVLKRFFTVRETFTDHSPETFQYLAGMVLGQYTVSAPAQSIVTGTFTFQGTAAGMTEVPIVGQTTLPASTTQVMNSSSNVGRIAEGGQIIAGKNYVLQSDLNINNNLRYQNAVGSIGAVGIGAGEFNCTGTLNTYFDDKTIAQKVIENTESSFDERFTDSSGRTVLYFVPRLKYSAGAPTVPGKNQDVTVNASFQAILDPTYGFTLQISRYEEIL